MAAGVDLILSGGKIVTVDKFHNQVTADRLGKKVRNSGNTGMIQLGQQLRFAAKTLHAAAVMGEGVGKNFDRNLSVQLRVLGSVDYAHTTFAELIEDLEVSDLGACHVPFPAAY